MNYIEKQLLLSSAVKAIDFLGSTSALGRVPVSQFKFEDEPLSASGADPMQTLDLLHQQQCAVQDSPGAMALCMPETVTPALATSWLISTWALKQSIHAQNNDNDMLTNIRRATERWLKKLLPIHEQSELHFLPDHMSANVRAMVIARDALFRKQNWDADVRGIFQAPALTIVASSALGEQAHAALRMAGFGTNNIKYVPTLEDGTMDIKQLPPLDDRTILYLQAKHPITGTLDNGEAIMLAKSQGAWVHIDASVTLWMNLSLNKKALFTDYHLADSWATDTQYWFECPEELGILACRHPSPRSAFDTHRISAVASLWASLRSLGESGLQSRIVRSTVYVDYLSQRLLGTPVVVMGGGHACHVLISFEHDERAKLACEAFSRSGVHEASLVYWQGRMRVQIPLLSWKLTPEWMEEIVSIIQETSAHKASLASA